MDVSKFNGSALFKALAIAAAVSMLFGCRFFEDPDVVETDSGVQVQRTQLGQGPPGNAGPPGSSSHFVSVDMVATDDDGNAVSCDDADIEADIEVSYDGPGQGFDPVDETTVRSFCGEQVEADVAIVVDNSGSLESFVDEASNAAQELAHQVIDDGGRVSLVRVSSHAEAMTGLIDDKDEVDDVLDGLFVNDGWTALYDGIRIGNQTLAGELASIDDDYDDLDDFCSSQNPFYVVALTDGQDNNSMEQEMATPDGDGIDTDLEDLFELNIGGVDTPVYTVGVGVDVDHAALSQLADETGGKHFQASTDAAISQALTSIADYPAATHRLCAETSNSPQQGGGPSQQGCGVSWTQVNYGDGPQSDVFSGSDTQQTQAPCPHSPPSGRSVGLLFKLSHPSVDAGVAADLAENAVQWAADDTDPEVLIVRDNSHNDHFDDDPVYIEGLLDDAGIDATFIDEPDSGVSPGTLSNYDVVWFSNPDEPMSDKSSLLSMLKFIGDGGGVVLSGDDMTASKYHSFSMDNLLHVDHESNGTYTCGDYIYGDTGQEFTVDIPDSDHPVLNGIAPQSFDYGYNIDLSTPLDRGEEVLAQASYSDGEGCSTETPAIIAFSGQ